jgi:pyrroline-5-carboxylate reductase
MAEAIVRGLLKSGLYRPEQIVAADVAEPRRRLFADELRVRAVEDGAEAAKDAKALLLSVKPYQMAEVLSRIGMVLDPRKTLVISIAAGIPSATIARHLGEGAPWRVIRSMPNTPMLVGEGMVGIAAGQNATRDDLVTARRIFEASADVIEVSEDKIDAVTAVSGSGPAYFFYVVEHMIRAGVELGLSEEQARRLASKTALGAARMLLASPDTPQELRRKVTTPNGTTHAAISRMEDGGVGAIIVEAVKAAERRGKELGA